MGEITLENNTNNALKVDLATLLQGEDTDNNWIKTNEQGYTKSGGRKETLSSLTTATSVQFETIDVQAVSVYNAGPDPLYMAVGEPVYVDSAVIDDAIHVPAGLAVTIPAYAAHDNDDQVSLILASGTQAVASVMVVGNAPPS